MSFKRKAQRVQLRSVREEESAFRQTAAVFGAFIELGLTPAEIQVGFVPSPGATKTATVPIVIVRRGEKSFTYRLNDFELHAPQEVIDERWQDWLGDIRGDDDQALERAIKRFYESSRFATLEAKQKLHAALLRAGCASPLYGVGGHIGRTF